MQATVFWKARSAAGFPAKHYVVRKDSKGKESYIHCVRILMPNRGVNNPANAVKVFKDYVLIEYWEYYTVETWATIFEAITKIKEYNGRRNCQSHKR